MLSKRAYKIFCFITKYGTKCGAWAASLDPNTQLFSQLLDRRVENKIKIHYACSVFWAIASFLLLVKHYISGDTQQFKMTFLFWTAGITVMNLFAIPRFYSKELLRSTNAALIFLRQFHAEYMPHFNTETNKLNLYIDAALCVNCILWSNMSLFACLFCFYDPCETIFLGGLIPSSYYRYFPWGFLIAIFHAYMIFIQTVSIAIVAGVGLIYHTYVTVLITRELQFGLKLYRTLSSLRCLDNVQSSYRAFQILHANVYYIVGPFLMFFHTMLTLLPVYASFVLIKYWKDLDLIFKLAVLPTTFGAGVLWTCTLQLGKYLFVSGQKTIWSWKRFRLNDRTEARIMGRFRRSCSLILICAGKGFVVKRITPFQYVKGLVRGTFRSLMTLSEKLD